MARWGRCNFTQLRKLQEKLNRLERADLDKFSEQCAKELAARLLAKVIKRTPVGNYENGKVGGILRRGWTAKSEREAELSAAFGGKDSAKKFAESIEIKKVGNSYEIEIINQVSYASYVEYGHRTANHNGWVEGRFILTISENEIESQAPKILERKLMKYLKECFND